MIKSLCLIVLLVGLASQQKITPYYILPAHTTLNVYTSYSFLFHTDTDIPTNAKVALTFPKEFVREQLPQVTRVRYSTDGFNLQNATWSLYLSTFTIQINQITAGNLTIVIDNVQNPKDLDSATTTSSTFIVQTLFQDVVVSSNTEFGRTTFTPAPITTTGGTYANQPNTYIEQGSSWAFKFTPSKTYEASSSLRFIFPEGFISNKVQCNVSGIIDPNMQTRVFPSQHIYDCLNLKQAISGSITVILSGLVNPTYELTVSGVQVHILQPNNLVVREIITSSSSVIIKNKPLNATVTIPHQYRNASTTHIFQINFDSNLYVGDYVQFTYTGNWTLFTDKINVISGITSTPQNKATWTKSLGASAASTLLQLSNFSLIAKSTQLTFYLPLLTPLNDATYSLTINAYRRNGKLAQSYSKNIIINQTTGYIKEMKLHPMQSPVKLPVGKTGPIEIVLFLRNNLPKTNVLTWGHIIIEITPNIPAPITNLNGVPKCYFYDNKPAANCTFVSSNPLKTVVTIFTPIDFNFQQSEVPLTITTEGYQLPQNQGITIDTLVKRYFFEIQFYSNQRPYPIPQQVLFDEWVADSIPLTSLTCSSRNSYVYQNDHLKCSFVTPNQVLNSGGHIHFFRVEFQGSGWNYATVGSLITPNYPCLMWGTNVSADPYVKCDYVTWTSGAHRSQLTLTSYSYITFYGLSTIPGGSTINFEIPNIPRNSGSGYAGTIQFSILEDTPGFNSPLVYLYTKTLTPSYNTGGSYMNQYYQTPTVVHSNSVVNKVNSITLSNYAFGVNNPDTIVLYLDQTGFPNIGRSPQFACGSNVCSKFDKPVQYFIMYPSANLGTSASITFPNIVNPPYSATNFFQFRIRVFQNGVTIKKGWFYVSVNPDTITTRSYTFHTSETVTTLYPKSNHLYTISWTTVNPLLSLSGNSYIKVVINDVFTFSSSYCQLTSSGSAYDGRNIFCDLSAGGTIVLIKNLADLPAASTFSLTVQMISTATTSTVSPTVNIYTYYGNGNLVDQALNVPFATTPLTNTNLTVFSVFTVPKTSVSTRPITAGYFGHLILKFQPQDSLTVTNGSRIVITMASGFVPAGNALNLPIVCQLNSVYFTCTYTISPFTITLYKTNNTFTTGINTINITTLYQNANGVTFPSTQGRYLNTLQILNQTTMTTLEKVQQYIDILPPDIAYFNVSWANRDRGAFNIFTVQIKNGPTPIPAYNDGANAGRIYVGFPLVDKSSGSVFAADLGFSGIKDGAVLPCFFQNATGFAGPISVSKPLQCRIRKSLTSNYNTWIEIINFAQIAAGGVMRVFIAKITNPTQQNLDINFELKVNSLAVATNIQSQIYYTTYNMWIDMLSMSITNRNQVDSSAPFFQAGATVGDINQYFNITPYTGTSGFATNDWWIIDLDPQFPLSGNIYNCQKPYYQYCIIYPTINWLAVKIGNSTILSLQPFVSKLPISISRVDTTFKCYTFLNGRWAQTITYTMTAAGRWLALRGTISNFTFNVVGSQNKLNINQKNVEVTIGFKVQHMVPIGGTIQIQFPNTNSTIVPAIKMHCRSAVTMGSALNGFNTGKPAVNVQGQIGCTVQNTYSWLITGFDELAAGSQVIIYGTIDFPTIAVNTLGMGYICTYSNQHATNAFTTAQTIDYVYTNFPILVQNYTWNVDSSFAMTQNVPLRINHVGDLKFILNLGSTFQCTSFTTGNCGQIYIYLYITSITGAGGGFGGPPSVLVCSIINPVTFLKYGCRLLYSTSTGNYYKYYITTYQDLPANTDLEVTMTSLAGSGTEGFTFPTSVGVYKIDLQINYCDTCTNNKAQAQYIQVYGPNWGTLFFNSTVSIPSENNFILVTLIPPSNIATTQQIVIEIPTVAIDGSYLFPADLGRGYKAYDNLVFDLYESTISSMTCKVYPGDATYSQPTKIVCSSFSGTLTSASTIKFGFWVVNPTSTIGMAIPIQVYAYDQPSATKFIWSIVEAGIRILPITQTPINDLGNFASSNAIRQKASTSLSFTTRNTKIMVKNDWYILKFGFDLRQTANSNGAFNYNSGLGNSGDVIFMRNSQTILLRVGTSNLTLITPGSTQINARITSLIYNPPYQLTTQQATIYAYAIYNSVDDCERIYYRDLYPTLAPNQPASPTFSITSVYTNTQKGMYNDFQFQFTMSTVSPTTSTSLVKYISIQFPNASTSDVQLLSRSCHQNLVSSIQVTNCVIDIDNRVIWITPVVKSAYSDSTLLSVFTAGQAIRIPKTNVLNQNMFVIRYYTWPDGQPNPGITSNSDNWCFMKQDSTNLNSVNLPWTSFSTGTFAQHTSLYSPNQLYVNQWQPADYYIGNVSVSSTLSKSPFAFKFLSPAAFNSLQGSGNYHSFSVDFGVVYNYPTLGQSFQDLYYYVPVCYLNGFSILSCSISGTVITMNFQQGIASGEVVAVTFSIINPTNQADFGFNLANLNNPSVTFGVKAYNYNSGITYLMNPEHFHTFYKTTSAGATYPSFGIQGITITVGTPVVGQLNYLQFGLTLTRTDINGFIIQIPVLSQDGTKIYNDSTLLGLQSGSAYPCSLGIYTPVSCFYQKGNSNGFGTPTRIYVSGFTLSSTSVSFRMLFTNPDNTQVFPTFIWKAFTGSFTTPNLMGSQFAGIHTILDAFKVFPTTGYYYTGTSNCRPSLALWQPTTTYDCFHGTGLGANTYAIMKWPLVDPTYGTIGDYDYTSVDSIYDVFYMYTATNQYYVYLVQKRPSGFTATTDPTYGNITSKMTFGYLRMKHHIVNGYTLYLLGKPTTYIYTCTVDTSWVQTNKAASSFNAWSIGKMDVQNRMNGQWGWQFYSFNTGNITNYLFDQYDPSQKIVQVQFTSTKPYSSLTGASSQCIVQSGLVSNDPLNPITCSVDNTNDRILFKNVFWFTNTIFNFYYRATTNSDITTTSFTVYVWANQQAYAYALRNHMIFSTQLSTSTSLSSIYYASYPGYSVMDASQWSLTSMDLTGSYRGNTRILNSHNSSNANYARIVSLTSTAITIQVYGQPSSSISMTNTYRVGFRFYTQRLTVGTCTAASIRNSLGANLFNYGQASVTYTCGPTSGSYNKFYVIAHMNRQPSYSTGPSQFPDYSSSGNTYRVSFTFTSITGDYTYYPNSLWVSGSMVWEQSYYYYHNSICGCGTQYRCNCDSDGYGCSDCCRHDNTCRRMDGFDYNTFTGAYISGSNNYQYAYPSKSIASSISTDLVSNQYGEQTQYNFYISNLATAITSTMNSLTATSNAQLIVEFVGNNRFDNGFFPYTKQTESAAYIDCLCTTSATSFSIDYTTSYSQANCTRYLISGMNPFISVRLSVSAGSWLRCFFPGFANPASGYGSTMSNNFFISDKHFFTAQTLPYSHYSDYQTLSIGTTLSSSTSTSMSFTDENNLFWYQSGKVDQSANYYLNVQSSTSYSKPIVYYSAYYPKPSQTACANTSFLECRTYSSFTNRRYFMIARYNSSTNNISFSYNALFPDSKDAASSFYKYYVGFTAGGYSYYKCINSTTSTSGYLSPATPTYGVNISIYGSYLKTYSSPFVLSVNLDGKTLYSNQRTVGPFIGSYIKLQASGFSSISGCGAYLEYNNKPAFFNNALYCLVTSSDTLKIWSNSDVAFTGNLIITFSTTSVPSSTTFNFTLYDKYISGADYAISVDTSATLSNNPTGYTILQPTNILWRRQAYKQLRTDAGPLRLTFNNNFQYVSAYSMGSLSQDTANSNVILMSLPGNVGVSTTYKCFARQYLPTKYDLYTQYPISCSYYDTNKVRIQPIPSHILNPAYYYDFIIYINGGSGTPFITASSSASYSIQVWTLENFASTTLFYDILAHYKYNSVYPITLNKIYILTREAAILNSLYIDFSVANLGNGASYLEFVFDSLDLNYFGISNGGTIPCQIISGMADYSSGISKKMACYGFSDGVNSTSPLTIRVINFNVFTAAVNIKIVFDNFNNPPVQTLFAVPINLVINLVDTANTKLYTSSFPNIYYSDSMNVQATSVSSGSLAVSTGAHGSGANMNWYVVWPYNTGSASADKLVMKINGGMTCCRAFSSLSYLTDNYGVTYTALWTNNAANTTVYIQATRSSGVGITFYINDVINPNPVSYATYQQGLSATFLWYSNYKTYNKYTLTQPNYSAYSMNSDFSVGVTGIVLASIPPTFSSHQYYPLTYQFSWSVVSTSYNNRNLSYIILQFTGGVRWIDAAWFRYTSGTINSVGSPRVSVNPANSRWFINITGIKDSSFSPSTWYLRVRLYANNNNQITFTSTLYNYNGLQQFNQGSGTITPSSNSFSTSTLYGTPNTWNFFHQRYTKNYYELQRTPLYAKSGLTTQKINFKFTTPYNISQVQSFSFVSSSTTFPASTTPNNGIYCIFQKTSTTYLAYGAGLYAPCTYSSGVYNVQMPVGGLAAGNEYLLTVIDRQQLTSTFNMPTSPQRVEISLIYNHQLNIAYGDVYTLDFAGYMTTYSVTHAHLQSGNYDMLGFNLKPAFQLLAASTSGSITESVLSFEVQSKYYDPCLDITSVISPTGNPYYNGIYYSHFATIAVPNANTRTMCGMNTQTQNWAPAKLTITDYGALSTATNYFFRFPLIRLPSGSNVPLTYKVKLLYYPNGSPYPTIISFFNYEAKDLCTGATTDTTRSSYLSLTSSVVQTTMTMTFGFSSWSWGSTAQTLIHFRNNYYPALTSITTLASLSNGYTYQYYPNINLCSFTGVAGSTISLGTYPTSIDTQNFQIYWVHTYTGTVRYRGWFNSNSERAIYTVNPASSWTSTSILKGSNLLSTNSWDLFTFKWSANYLTFPEGSYMIVTFQPQLNLIDQYCYSYSGFSQGTNTNSNLVCKRYSSNQVIISGYAALATSAQLIISVYMWISDSLSINSTLGSNNNFNTYATVNVYSSAANSIVSGNISPYTLALSNIRGSNLISLSGTMNNPYTAGQAFPLYITFQLNTNSLVGGDYLQVDFGNWVLDAATTGTAIFKYQVSGNIYWVPVNGTKLTGNMYKVPVYSSTYPMNAGSTITLWVDTFAPTSYYGASVSSTQWNTFKIYAYKSAGTLVEQNIYRIWTEPFGHSSLVVTPALTYVGATTLYQFTVTPNISASAGDTILIEFSTSDGLTTSNLFSNTIGASITAPYPGQFDCNQGYGAHVISDSSISCRVYQGNNAANPPIPTTIAIPIKKAISSGTLIRFNILYILNPNTANYPIGIIFKLSNACSTSDSNNLCAYYKSVTYNSFVTAPGSYGFSYTGSLSFSPSNVSATNTVHTVTAAYSVATGNWIKLSYYTQVPVPAVCTITAGAAECYSYPTTNVIMIKVLAPQTGSYSFSMGGMTNPYQNYYGNYTFNTEIWSGATVSGRFHSDYQASTLFYDPTTLDALSISFTPTLTPDYQLKFGFNNIAKIELTHLIQNKYVQMIYISAPSDITLDSTYCNATMKTNPGEAIPYPFRFVCQSQGTNYVMLNMQSDFPAWTADFTGRSIFIYLRYVINDNQFNYGNNWTAQAYAHPSSTSYFYLVSQGSGRFKIVQYQTPYLWVISLFTRSFGQRTCTINQQCMFYGFLLPSTLKATIPIGSMTFLLPKQFNYSTAQTLTKCTLQPTTTLLYTFSCSVTRNNSQITISYTPPTYNQGYNLLNLDNGAANMLFTSPKYPGDHYQMQVNLWSTPGYGNTLVQTQYINLTTVYGYYLAVPPINFVIPKDAGGKGLFDLTFTVGSADILPSYTNSESNSITSAIEISFAKTFDFDLGTGLQAGAEIACLNISGLTFNTMGRIKCQIYPSVSTITYPTIVITGYDRIYNNTVVRIQFANLKTLPADITDYCTLGVSLTYFTYGRTKGYIYQPVSFVVGPTSAPNSPKSITFTVSQVGTNTVGQLTNYTFAGTLESGFSPITSSDYFVIQFPQYTFEGRFNLNTQALCSLAANSKCSIFGLASQIYIQPSSTVSTSAFSFTLNKILNAAFSIQYLNRTVTLFTVINNKVNALGTSVFLKFTQASSNVSAIITGIDSIYGGDSGINYYFSFQLNSYLPEGGKISVFFPSVFQSLFNVNSRCFLRSDSKLLIGKQSYCQIINSYQLVIVPNGVLLSSKQPYYFNLTNITNPNFNLSAYKFSIYTYYTNDVYQPLIISQSQFASPIVTPITVKVCNFALELSMANPGLSSNYIMKITCPSTIKSASRLKVYLSWNPPLANGICSSDASTLYSQQCNTVNQYNGTTKLTLLSIWLRSISAQKPVIITSSLPNGIQGTYTLNATISYNQFVYMTATSNSFYIFSSTTTSTTTNTNGLSVKSANYPLNRLFSSIYTFAFNSPQFSLNVSSLSIDVPSVITKSSAGLSCNYYNFQPNDDYFNLMLLQNQNTLKCEMKGQKLTIYNLSIPLKNLTKTDFLYLTVNGLVNPQTSVSQVNFNFTFISSNTSTYSQGILIFSYPLSYTISSPPTDIQIGAIILSNDKYKVASEYTFSVSSVNGVTLSITQSSQIGIMINFPAEYESIWSQITVPTSLNLTISGNNYTASNVTMSTRYLYAVFSNNTFTSQINFTTFNITFMFRNPNFSLDCSVLPVFTISLFDFKGKSIYAQTLSNNKVCPTFSTYLYTINVTGNTKISAGSSSQFIVSLEKPAQNLKITPVCASSAISFSPSTIVFANYTQLNQTFNISAANGLSGNFKITFSKVENSSYTFYNDIPYITLNVQVPTSQYYIKLIPFKAKSNGNPIVVTIQLEVGSPTSFKLITSHNCSSYFTISPQIIQIPAQVKEVNFTVTHKGTKVPKECYHSFKISSITKNNYYLHNQVVYYSSSVSIDNSALVPPMILQLTTVYQSSTNVGFTISSVNSTNVSTLAYAPKVHELNFIKTEANSASFIVGTFTQGIVYYTIVPAGTPSSLITAAGIYNQSITSAVTYGYGIAAKQNGAVNIKVNLVTKGLKTQQNYTVAAYLNSTLGVSDIFFKNFTTAKASNGAAIKIAMSNVINVTKLINALSSVLRIIPTRIYVITPSDILLAEKNQWKVQVMNNRRYIYDTVIAPNPDDDSTSPLSLLSAFVQDSNAKAQLSTFIPQYIPSYSSTIRQLINKLPRHRNFVRIVAKSYNSVSFTVSFWDKQFVYAVLVQKDERSLLSRHIINGLNAENKNVIIQHYANVTTDDDGSVTITFNLLNDNSKYYLHLTAECPLPYGPRLALADQDVMKIYFETPINPNLMRNKDIAAKAIQKIDRELAKKYEAHAKYNDHLDRINKVDKSAKLRVHGNRDD